MQVSEQTYLFVASLVDHGKGTMAQHVAGVILEMPDAFHCVTEDVVEAWSSAIAAIQLTMAPVCTRVETGKVIAKLDGFIQCIADLTPDQLGQMQIKLG